MNIKTHIEAKGKTLLSARIAGTNLKAVLVAQFIQGWGLEHALEHYGISPADAHAAMVFYYDNETEIKTEEARREASLKKVGVDAHTHLDEIRKRKQS